MACLSWKAGQQRLEGGYLTLIANLHVDRRIVQLDLRSVTAFCCKIEGLSPSKKAAQADLVARDDADHHTPTLARDREVLPEPQRVDDKVLGWVDATQRCTQEDAGVD
jgi:hypothetical protein